MALNVANITLGGNLTEDPVEIKLQSGGSLVKFGMAVNEFRKNKEGQNEKSTSYFDVKVFGEKGEHIMKFFKKGKPIFLTGQIKQERFVGKDDKPITKFTVYMDRFEFVGAPEDNVAKVEKPVNAKAESSDW